MRSPPRPNMTAKTRYDYDRWEPTTHAEEPFPSYAGNSVINDHGAHAPDLAA